MRRLGRIADERRTGCAVFHGRVANLVASRAASARVAALMLLIWAIAGCVALHCEPSGKIIMGVQVPAGASLAKQIDGAMAGLSCDWKVTR